MVLMWLRLRRWPRLRRTGIAPPRLQHRIWLSGMVVLLSRRCDSLECVAKRKGAALGKAAPMEEGRGVTGGEGKTQESRSAALACSAMCRRYSSRLRLRVRT